MSYVTMTWDRLERVADDLGLVICEKRVHERVCLIIGRRSPEQRFEPLKTGWGDTTAEALCDLLDVPACRTADRPVR